MVGESGASKRRDTYRWQTLRAFNGLLFILPMLLVFHVGTAAYGTNLRAPLHLDKLLKYFGATAAHLPAVMVVVVLVLQHLFHKDPWTVQPKVLAGMLGESILWMVPLIAMGHLAGRLIVNQAASGPPVEQVFQKVLQALGAGIYEEFMFRLALISLLMLVLVDILGLSKKLAVPPVLVVSAVAFSLYHFSGEQLADLPNLPWGQFLFRAAAGVYLAGLYVCRGFGIAVATHAFYNIYVLVTQP